MILSYRDLFKGHLDSEMLNQVRKAANHGMALGNERFRKEIELLCGRRVTLLKRGPKPKSRDVD